MTGRLNIAAAALLALTLTACTSSDPQQAPGESDVGTVAPDASATNDGSGQQGGGTSGQEQAGAAEPDGQRDILVTLSEDLFERNAVQELLQGIISPVRLFEEGDVVGEPTILDPALLSDECLQVLPNFEVDETTGEIIEGDSAEFILPEECLDQLPGVEIPEPDPLQIQDNADGSISFLVSPDEQQAAITNLRDRIAIFIELAGQSGDLTLSDDDRTARIALAEAMPDEEFESLAYSILSQLRMIEAFSASASEQPATIILEDPATGEALRTWKEETTVIVTLVEQ